MKNIYAEIEILGLKNRNEIEELRYNKLNEFISIYNSCDTFTKDIINEVCTNTRHQGVNIVSITDKSKDVYQLNEKNIAKYGVRTFKNVFEKKNTVGTVNFIYENSVNNERERENITETFVASPRVWGYRINPAIVIHNGEIYLSIKFLYTDNVTRFDENDEIISDDIFSKWQLDSKKSDYKKQIAQKNQLVEDVIIINDFKIKNIQSIKINKKILTR